MKFKKWIAYVCLLAVCSQISACDKAQDMIQEYKERDVDRPTEQKAFDEFLQKLFVKEVQSDSITLNYTLKDPEAYGITDFKPTLGEYGVEAEEKQRAEAENIYKKLTSFAYTALTDEQKITYDILEDYYKIDEKDEKYTYYGEVLKSSTGIQAELPILLSEYNISDKKDLDQYIDLLYTVEDYFEDIKTYEEEKSEKGLFMPDENADQVISQCEDFVKTPNKNLLITIFDERLDSYDWLSQSEKTSYKEKNKEAVIKSVIPAYQGLIDTLTKLKGTSTYTGGVGNLPDGKKYYERLAQGTTGSDMNISEMKEALEDTMSNAISSLVTLSSKDNNVENAYYSMEFPMTDPDEILEYLTDAVKKDFPALDDDIRYTVKYVDKSLEDHVSPAFYLSPQIDNYKKNSIYINGGKNNNLDNIFPTLAHEGYPGHLLQNVYARGHSRSELSSVISYGGYSEGWATYCELYSYNIAGLDDNLGEFAKQYDIFNLCLYAQMDIGVNYDCWTKDELSDYLTKFGIDSQDATTEIYNIVTDDPGNYLQYVIGYIEFMNLREKAEDALGDDFNAKDFHTFLLNIGPAPFEVIEDHMKDWIRSYK